MKKDDQEIRGHNLSKIYEDTLALFKVTHMKLKPNKTNTWKATKVFIIVAADAGFVVSELANFLNVESEIIKKLRFSSRQTMRKGELDKELCNLRKKYPPNTFHKSLGCKTRSCMKEKQKDAINEGKLNAQKRLKSGNIPIVLKDLIHTNGCNL